jgi:hypothetical protein
MCWVKLTAEYEYNLLIGPILISLDVPKKQYKVAPTKDVLYILEFKK